LNKGSVCFLEKEKETNEYFVELITIIAPITMIRNPITFMYLRIEYPIIYILLYKTKSKN